MLLGERCDLAHQLEIEFQARFARAGEWLAITESRSFRRNPQPVGQHAQLVLRRDGFAIQPFAGGMWSHRRAGERLAQPRANGIAFEIRLREYNTNSRAMF